MSRRRFHVAAVVGWLLLGAVGCQTRTGDEMDPRVGRSTSWAIG